MQEISLLTLTQKSAKVAGRKWVRSMEKQNHNGDTSYYRYWDSGLL
jgi:hypothetical protein